MIKKSQVEVINELQYNTDVVILNNPLSAPKLIQKLGRGKGNRLQISEVYTPKLFYDIISRITPEHSALIDNGDTTVKITLSIAEFLKSVNAGNSKSLYGHVIDCIDTLQSTQVKWTDSEKDYGTAIITHYEHNRGSGKIEVVLYKELVKKVVEVTENEHFSFFKRHLYQLQNAQAIKLFPYFVSWRNRGMVEISLDTFKEKFGYDTVGYRFFNNLKSKVLDPAINEINEKTDLTITYKLIGTNLDGARPRITGFQFFIQEKKRKLELPESASTHTPEALYSQTIETVEPIVVQSTDLNEDIMNKYYEQIADFWGVDKRVFVKNVLGKSETDIQKAMDYTKEQVRAGKANKPAAVFIDALRNGYKTADVLKKEAHEQKTKAAKEKMDTLKRVEAVVEKQTKQQKQVLYEQELRIFTQLIAEDNGFIQALTDKVGSGMFGSYYKKDKTFEDNLNNPLLKATFLNVAKELKPERF